MSRIGVFVCHCGENIARTVDVAAVADALRDHPGVVHSEDYKYMCSDPGQALVKKAIEENGLTGVVICSGSLPAKIAQAIDAQFDDGNMLSGTVRGQLETTPPTAVGTAALATGTAGYQDNGTNLYTICKNI